MAACSWPKRPSLPSGGDGSEEAAEKVLVDSFASNYKCLTSNKKLLITILFKFLLLLVRHLFLIASLLLLVRHLLLLAWHLLLLASLPSGGDGSEEAAELLDLRILQVHVCLPTDGPRFSRDSGAPGSPRPGKRGSMGPDPKVLVAPV